MKSIIALLTLLLKKENVRDYLVLILVVSYVAYVGHQVFGLGQAVPMEFTVLVSGAISYYFGKNNNGAQ